MEDRLLQLELDMEHLKRDVHELRDILIQLTYAISDIDKKIVKYVEGSEVE
jgi:hypothetical protein